MCEVLGVSRSGYYHWKKELRGEKKYVDLDKEIADIFERSKITYGSPRIHKELIKKGISVSESTVSRRMSALGLSPEVKKKFVVTTASNHAEPIAENLLNREFYQEQIGKVWVGDITYIRVLNSFVYLTTVIDLADRSVVGWHLSDNMRDEDTTVAAFRKAAKRRKLQAGAMFHSDQGVQYASRRFKAELTHYNCAQSMSRRGNCWDNAVAESFFKTIKKEALNRYNFTSIEEVYTVVFDYIDGWYNTKRIHSSLGYLSPREKFLELQAYKTAA